MKNAAPTLRDVAKLAGVSVGTVSKYLNRPELVREDNRLSIERAIHRLQYTPNTLARRLATGRSNTLLLSILSESRINDSTWLHLLPLIQALADDLRPTSYNLQIKLGSIGAPQETLRELESCIAGRTIDGLILLSAWDVPEELVHMLLAKRLPFVLAENRSALLPGSQVLFDNREMAQRMVDYLAGYGHRRIAFLQVQTRQQHMRERLDGFLAAMERHGLAAPPEYIESGDFSIGSGAACMARLLQLGEAPTAVVCGNDNMAAGAVRELRRRGLSVPGDMSVMGIDNSVVAQALDPPLATMATPMEELGRAAVRELLKKLEDPSYEIPRIVLPCSLVPGGSVGPPKPSITAAPRPGI